MNKHTKPEAVWFIEEINGHKGVTCTNCLHRDSQFFNALNGCMHYCPYCGAKITKREEKKVKDKDETKRKT